VITIVFMSNVNFICLINLVDHNEECSFEKRSSEGQLNIDIEGDNKKVAFDRGVNSIGPEDRTPKSAMAKRCRTKTVGSEFLKSGVSFDQIPSEVPTEVKRVVPGEISEIKELPENHFSSPDDETLKSNLGDSQDIKKP
jgi:hypothetical protein